MINYLVCEIGHKLSTRSAPENGYVRRTTVKIPIDQKVFEELFSPFGNVAAEDLDKILPGGWSEQAFRTSTKCVVSRAQRENSTTTVPNAIVVSGHQEKVRSQIYVSQRRHGLST